MPDATIIGFTGTPLLQKDKKTSLEVFGPYIHTYKFDEGVRDGVILDLRYEARDVDQYLSSAEKTDQWFEAKTAGLTECGKAQLKRSWATLSKLYSSKDRLQRIVADIMADMVNLPRLKQDRGTAMLVAGSIYEACRYYDLFTSSGFNKCAIVTSYVPSDSNVRTATSDLDEPGEAEYKESVYRRMLGGESIQDFETRVKEEFKKEPAKMKLLIVVDRLLTGFDAPSATYLYIDKSMRDHDLFQAICRVNRPDDDSKDYGFIVDYKDLFRSVQLVIDEYTSGAFDDYAKEDVDGLIKNRYNEAKAEMVGALHSLDDLLSPVDEPEEDAEYIQFFCGDSDDDAQTDENAAKRDTLYSLTASLTRSFGECCDRLESHFDYTHDDVQKLRSTILNYNRLKDMIKLASADFIDLKPYEEDMRFILDNYVRAEDSKVVSSLDDIPLVQLLLDKTTTTPIEQIIDGLPGSNEAKAETIENNLTHEIVRKMSTNEIHYGKLSEMLKKVIDARKIEAITYEEYLRQVVELAKSILHPEESEEYPEAIRDSEARRALYD
ncbi:MAG: DUF3387 domain-containing protein, partial [Atopobium minutum]|nr:DUF3387 domain-containing protein [Atopobium minutum]